MLSRNVFTHKRVKIKLKCGFKMLKILRMNNMIRKDIPKSRIKVNNIPGEMLSSMTRDTECKIIPS